MRKAAVFLTSASGAEGFPPERLPEFAFAGRSNVGKSSLINGLLGSKLARTSRTPGRTRLLNWFVVGEGKTQCYFVDLPGYGFAQVNRDTRKAWQPLIETYLQQRTTLAALLLLVDIRRGVQSEEVQFVDWLIEKKIPVWLVATKSDQLPKHKRQLATQAMRRALGLTREPFAVSMDDPESLAQLWRALRAPV